MALTGPLPGLAIAYGIVAAFALALTWAERRRKGQSGLVPALLGLLACLFWPLTLAWVALLITRARREARPAACPTACSSGTPLPRHDP